MELFDSNELRQALLDLANDVEENYKSKLVESHHYTTNYTLLDSIRTEVQLNDTGFEVVMTLKDYWKYVEEGTPPHFPPLDKILEWIEIKPVLPKPSDGRDAPTPAQLAYLIGRKISIEGTQGSHDLERTLDAVIPLYKERLEDALHHDVEIYIRKVMAE